MLLNKGVRYEYICKSFFIFIAVVIIWTHVYTNVEIVTIELVLWLKIPVCHDCARYLRFGFSDNLRSVNLDLGNNDGIRET